MKFAFLGINYKNAGLDVRDRIYFTDGRKLALLESAGAIGVSQCLILSTCNRSEVFFFYDGEEQYGGMERIYTGLFGEEAGEYLKGMKGVEALSYLFRITAGLESLVPGEDQILGQVKEALDFSRVMGYAKKEMNKVVRDAVTCAKRIKTELRISERPLSVSYVGLQKLEEVTGIKGKKVLVVGSGRTACLSLRYIYDYKAAAVYACSRTPAHARRLKEEFPTVKIVEYEDRYRAMEACDIVLTATASPHLVVRRERLRPDRPLVFLDLAAPRDVDPDIGKIPGMRLIDLDTLKEIAAENLRERERLAEDSRKIIEQDLRDTMDWIVASRMDSTIESLQQRCSEIVEDSYAYLNRRMELGRREQKILRKVLNASLQRLLREPIQELKQLDSREKQEEYREIVNRLFQI